MYVLAIDIHLSCRCGDYYYQVAEQISIKVKLKELQEKRDLVQAKERSRSQLTHFPKKLLELSNFPTGQSTKAHTPCVMPSPRYRIELNEIDA